VSLYHRRIHIFHGRTVILTSLQRVAMIFTQ